MLKSSQYYSELSAIKKSLEIAKKAFKNGDFVLVADDGQRENEVDLVFHANGATSQNVNFTITHAKGLLCVSVSHDIADRMGFSTAPKFPGNISHTNFTLSVDARSGITTGISAKDRAHTISIMSHSETTMHDFISPGHVYPLRAMNGGLLSRTGHTEALYELCRLENLPFVAAMCEVLGEDGSALTPKAIKEQIHNGKSVFNGIPMVSTVDILWGSILLEVGHESQFIQEKNFLLDKNSIAPISTYVLYAALEEKITLPTVLSFYKNEEDFTPETVRICITNSVSSWDNGVSKNNCCVEIALFSQGNCFEALPDRIENFTDLSSKDGLHKTSVSVRRALSEFRSLQFIFAHFKIENHKYQLVQNIKFLENSDADFLSAVFK